MTLNEKNQQQQKTNLKLLVLHAIQTQDLKHHSQKGVNVLAT